MTNAPLALRSPTPDDVVALWEFLSSHYRTQLVAKGESRFMKACGSALSLLRIQSRAEFMERYTTVINRTIYLPFELDTPGSEVRLWGRIAAGIHEHQHVAQAIREGFASFASRYLLSELARARWEAEAYGTELELMRWAGRPARSPDAIADGLRAYGCGDAARAVALAELERVAASTEVRTEATQLAIPWLALRLADVAQTEH